MPVARCALIKICKNDVVDNAMVAGILLERKHEETCFAVV